MSRVGKKTGAALLAELRANRAAGKTRLSTYEVAEEEDLYDEVDEEGYKKIVRGRLDEDDFVVGDKGEGYVDDGREEWDEGHAQYRYSATDSEGEDKRPAKGKAGMRLYTQSIMHACTDAWQPSGNAKRTRRSGRRSTMASASTSARRMLRKHRSRR